jgi:hypothetical protein
MPGRRVRELNDHLEQGPHAEQELALPAFDRVINVCHERFAAWLSARLSVREREGGALAGGEWLYHGDWLTLFLALAGIRQENRFNIVDLYRACAGAGPPASEAHCYARCSESLPFEWPEGRIAVVAPGASEDPRRFVRESTVPLLSEIAALGFHSVLVGAPADQPLIRSLVEASAVPLTDVSGRTSVTELAEVVRRADLVVAADSGPAHIAAALRRPLVGLYGACLAPLTTAPWGDGHLLLVHDSMQAFTPRLVLAAVHARLGAAHDGDLRREAVAAGVQAWRTAMLPDIADPLGGVTYLPLHADRLDESETIRRILRHVLASVLSGKAPGDMRHLAEYATPVQASSLQLLEDCERQITRLAAAVGRGLAQLRRRQFGGLQELVTRVNAGVEELKSQALTHPATAPVVAFLGWKLRVMPTYEPQRTFREYERELQRAAGALRMAREAACGGT